MASSTLWLRSQCHPGLQEGQQERQVAGMDDVYMGVFFCAGIFQKTADGAEVAEYEHPHRRRPRRPLLQPISRPISPTLGWMNKDSVKITENHAGDYQHHATDDEQSGRVGSASRKISGLKYILVWGDMATGIEMRIN